MLGFLAVDLSEPAKAGWTFNFVFLWHFIIFDTNVCAVITQAYLIHLTQLVRDLIDR